MRLPYSNVRTAISPASRNPAAHSPRRAVTPGSTPVKKPFFSSLIVRRPPARTAVRWDCQDVVRRALARPCTLNPLHPLPPWCTGRATARPADEAIHVPRCAGPVVSVGGDVFGEAGVREREDDGAEDGADDAAAAGLDGDLALAGEQETGKRKCTTYWSRPNMVCVRTHPTCKAGPRLCGVSSISSFSIAFACFCLFLLFFFWGGSRRGEE